MTEQFRFGDHRTERYAEQLFKTQWFDKDCGWPDQRMPSDGAGGSRLRDCHRCGSPRMLMVGSASRDADMENLSPAGRLCASCGWECKAGRCPVCIIVGHLPRGLFRREERILPFFRWRDVAEMVGRGVPAAADPAGSDGRRRRPVLTAVERIERQLAAAAEYLAEESTAR